MTETAELIGAVIGFLLTLLVFSYILGDNALFRLAVHIFIGVTAAYATIVVVYNVFWYRLIVPLLLSPAEQVLIVGPPLLLGVWLMLRVSKSLGRYTTPVLALMVGVGAAAAVGGAVRGTILPQAGASMEVLDVSHLTTMADLLPWLFNGLVVLTGTVTTLVYFHFGIRTHAGQPARKPAWLEITGMIGQGFIAVALGAMFAGVYAAALAAFVDRMHFMWEFFWNFLGRFIPFG